VFERDFLDTPAPDENATSITPLINGLTGPRFNCSSGELLDICLSKPVVFLSLFRFYLDKVVS
jgi:hypothetical protein